MTDKELFGMMCRDAFLAKCQAEIDAWDEGVNCTPDHYRKLSKIIGVRVGPKHSTVNKKIIALLIAAALLLLTACAVFIYREELRGLFVERLEDRDKVTANDLEKCEENLEISEIYYLGYVPEGFELNENRTNSIKAYYKYLNSRGEYLIFKQQTKKTNAFIDIQLDDQILYHNSICDIYYSYTGDWHCYTWYNDEYHYCLSSSKELMEEDVIALINGMCKFE